MPTAMGLSEFHYFLLHSDGLTIVSRITEKVVGYYDMRQMGYGGGTDFETPLNRALDIIEAQESYQKADVLMISDGDCGLSAAFVQTLNNRKAALDCSIYTVLCAGLRINDSFSDEVFVL